MLRLEAHRDEKLTVDGNEFHTVIKRSVFFVCYLNIAACGAYDHATHIHSSK